MRLLKSLRGDTDGAVVIEFAILAPVLITMLLGVFQIGVAMQNYNALRSVASEAARYASVERQKGATIAASNVRTQAISIGTRAPYALIPGRLTVNCANATVQRVPGATEMTLTIQYNVPSFLGMINVGEIPLTYTRPVFVI